MDTNKPLYKPGESVVLLHEWARDLPAQTIDNVIFDESWGCYTYAFVGKCLRIEEHELSPVGSNAMTAKLVSIRTRSGDDLTPAPALRPAKTISQRQAIKRICSRADPPIWPAVEKRLIESAEESDHGNGRDLPGPWRLLALFAFAASAAAELYLVILVVEKLFR